MCGTWISYSVSETFSYGIQKLIPIIIIDERRSHTNCIQIAVALINRKQINDSSPFQHSSDHQNEISRIIKVVYNVVQCVHSHNGNYSFNKMIDCVRSMQYIRINYMSLKLVPIQAAHTLLLASNINQHRSFAALVKFTNKRTIVCQCLLIDAHTDTHTHSDTHKWYGTIACMRALGMHLFFFCRANLHPQSATWPT